MSDGVEDSSYTSRDIIGLELDVLGESVHLRIRVEKDRVRLADVVPLAQVVCREITGLVVNRVRGEGRGIPCRKGCSSCCSSLVPLSVPEAFWLSDEILARPEAQRVLMERACFLAARHILGKEPPKPFAEQTKLMLSDNPPEQDLMRVANWYKGLRLACPFLIGGVCTVYEQRPLACREHFVRGTARACKGERGEAKVVEMPMRMVEVLGQLASELEDTSVEAVMTPLVLVWRQENLERDKQTWPASMMVERFIEIVKLRMMSKSSAAVVA